MEPNCLPEASRGSRGAPGPPWGRKVSGDVRICPPSGGLSGPSGEALGSLGRQNGTQKPPKWTRRGGQEALGRRLASEVVSGGVFSMFWGGFGLCCAPFLVWFFSRFGDCCPPHFRDVLGVPRCAEFVFFGAARKRAHLLKVVVLLIEFHVFHAFFVHRHRAEAKKKRNDNSKND